jgi:hypothetical protein
MLTNAKYIHIISLHWKPAEPDVPHFHEWDGSSPGFADPGFHICASYVAQNRKTMRKTLMAKEVLWNESVYSGASLLEDLTFQKFIRRYNFTRKGTD